MAQADHLVQVQWRTSSFSNGLDLTSTCVEVAAMPEGWVAVRNSNHPDAGAVYFTRAAVDAWIKGVKAANSTTSPDRPADLPEVTASSHGLAGGLVESGDHGRELLLATEADAAVTAGECEDRGD